MAGPPRPGPGLARYSQPAAETEQWAASVRETAGQAADLTARGARTTHMRHFGDVSDTASFQFGRPGRGYLNAGLLAGGGVSWQGWLVEVTVSEDALFASQARPRRFVVRMREGEVVEVVEAAYADGLRWADRTRGERPGEGIAANME